MHIGGDLNSWALDMAWMIEWVYDIEVIESDCPATSRSSLRQWV